MATSAVRWVLTALTTLCVATGCGPGASAPPPACFQVRVADGSVEISAAGVLRSASEEVVTVPPELSGRIEELVDEGTQVKKGDLVCRLSTSSLDDDERTARLELGTKRAELEKQHSDDVLSLAEVRSKVRAQQADLTANERILACLETGADPRTLASLALRIERAKIENASLQRRLSVQGALKDRGFLSGMDYESVRTDLTKARLDLAKQENLLALQREGPRPQERDKSRALVTKFRLSLALAAKAADTLGRQKQLAIAKKEAEIKDKETTVAERLRLRSMTVFRAPVDGTVVYSDSYWGDGFGPGSQAWGGVTLLKVVKRGIMQARVHVGERWVDRVQVGQSATVRAAGAVEWYVARVLEISRVAEQLTRDPKAPRMFPVVIRLDRDPPELRPNTSCVARIQVARHRAVAQVPLDVIRSRKGRQVELAIIEGSLGGRSVTVVDEDDDFVFVTGLADGARLAFPVEVRPP